MRHWSASLIGLPYKPKGRDRDGVDCWGLVRLGFDKGAAIAVPSYDQDYLSPDEKREIDAIVRREAASPLWHRVDDISAAREFDVLWFARGKIERHCGIYIRAALMLHIEEERSQSRLDDYRDIGLKLTGIYRWHELAR